MNLEVKSLTGIRGIAALWVVFLHYRHSINHNKESYIIKLAANGFIAVDIFFLLSAFVMCLAYSEEFKKPISKPSYFTFIKKRFIRIYPAYFFWIFMFLSFDFIIHEFNTTKILVNLLMIQNLFKDVEISFIFWSLSSEWILYLGFPFLYYVFQKTRNSYVRIFLISASLIGLYILPSINNYIIDFHKGIYVMYPKDEISIILGINSIARCFFSCVIGINLFLTIKDYATKDYLWIKVSKYCAIIGIFIISYFGKSTETYVLLLISSMILISSLYLNKENIDSFFDSKIVCFLGKISYSIYLCHMFILVVTNILIRKLFPSEYVDGSMQIYIVSGSIVFLIPISYLSYTFIEKKVGIFLKSKVFVKQEINRVVRQCVSMKSN